MRYIHSIFLVTLLLIPIGLVAHSGDKESATVIHMSMDGFSPTEVTVQPGDTVMFENVGTEPHWPASNVHPSHEIYSAFDPERPVEPHQSWSFTFDRAGDFRFHDHLYPFLTGVVHVKKSTEPDTWWDEIISWFLYAWNTVTDFFAGHDGVTSNHASQSRPGLESINATSATYQQRVDKYRRITKTQDPAHAIQALRRASADNDTVMRVCHDLVHTIGRTAYKRYNDFTKAMDYRDDFCNSGYIHGVLEGYFQHADDPLQQLGNACDLGKNARPFDVWECHHGLGHGFMYFTGGELPQALSLCQKRLRGSASANCVNGVYMELFNTDALAKEQQYLNRSEPFRVCRQMNKGANDCFFYVPTYLLQLNGNDFEATLAQCESIDNNDHRRNCVAGVGSEAMKRNLTNLSTVFSLCDAASHDTLRHACARGAVSIYMNQFGSYAAGRNLCPKVPARYRDSCEHVVTSRKGEFQQ